MVFSLCSNRCVQSHDWNVFMGSLGPADFPGSGPSRAPHAPERPSKKKPPAIGGFCEGCQLRLVASTRHIGEPGFRGSPRRGGDCGLSGPPNKINKSWFRV